MLGKLAAALERRCLLKADHDGPGVALVGIGGWGAANARALLRSRRFRLHGAYDISAPAAAQFAARYGVQAYASYAAVLADARVQAVVLTVPNPLHAEMVEQAARAGKHVFVEKPLASTPALCRELAALCRVQGVILQVGHQVRREPALCALAAQLASGQWGVPLSVYGIRTLRRPPQGWRADPAACPGGSMEQLGLHMIDAMVALFGAPAVVDTWRRNIPYTAEGPEWGHATLAFPGDVLGVIASSFTAPARSHFCVTCTGGMLWTDDFRTLWGRDARRCQKLPVTGPRGDVAQFLAFAACLTEGGTPAVGGEEAATVMEVVTAVASAYRDRHAV
ncbi:MAG TPA: Gfo/Idh/MocA family oxidoreductase [Armatimonadota bacterium]|nr:Gfo/Idh/MocA family oxidoreductase [Armatimonadota bacterium]HOS42718.1 Gfo/Idh/MocA family oxidoreductase [Armatimonadota bacterium]